MPSCAAYGCSNTTGRIKHLRTVNGRMVSLHPFPHDERLRQRWVLAIRRADPQFFANKTAHLCSLHFEPNMMVEDLKTKLTNPQAPQKVILKSDAVPATFVHRKQEQRKRPPTSYVNRHEVQEKKAMIENLISRNVEATTAVSSTKVSTSCESDRDTDVQTEGYYIKDLECVSAPDSNDEHVCDHDENNRKDQNLVCPPKSPEDDVIFIGGHTVTLEHEMEDVTVGEAPNLRDVPILVSLCASRGPAAEGRIFKSTRSVGTQWPEYEFNIVGDTTKIEKDHTYCGQSLELHSPSPRHSTQLDFHPPTHSTPVKVPQAVVSSSEESSSMGEPSMISCVNSENVTRGSTSSSDSLADESAILYDEDKYIVFISCLRQLFGHLTCFAGNCRKQLMIIKESVGGSQLIVDFVCPENHCFTWRSQPNVGRMPAGNFLAATGILLSGNTFKRVENFARSINLKLHSKKTHDAVQRSYLYPSIAHEFENELSRVSVVLKEKKLSLAGDGRCDSPGHCAKYGTYTLMDLDTNLIVSSHVTHVCEAGNSNAMEKLGLVKGLTSLRERCLDIETLTTDGHIQIASYLKKERPDIDHQLDLWHISKSVVKKLSNAAKKNVNSELKEWIKSIAYHLWFSVAACEKNADRLIEIWTSIVHHIANEHSWVTGDVVHKCLHESLSADVERKKRWLMPGSAPHKALSDIVFDKRLLTNLRKCNKFCHTGMLESFHALLLKFCPKRQHFWYDGMVARTSLAVLDHNQNVGREQATIKAGPMRGTKRFNIVHSKRGNQWVAKPIMEEKRTDYVRSIAIRALESKLNENTTRATLPQSQTETFKIPQNIAGNEKPNKADAIASFCSRFDKKC